MTVLAPNASSREVEKALRGLLPFHLRKLPADQPLERLGLDSMDLVDLLCALDEELRIRLSLEEFTQNLTLSGLVTAVRHRLRHPLPRPSFLKPEQPKTS